MLEIFFLVMLIESILWIKGGPSLLNSLCSNLTTTAYTKVDAYLVILAD